MRFTLDSNILVRALASPRGPALRVLEIIRRAHTLVLSQSILDEVERVLMYPRLQARYRITASEAARFTGNLAGVAHMVEPVIVRPLILSDPADDPVLYTAADGKADVLCTEYPALRHACGAGLLFGAWHPRHDRFGRSPRPFEIRRDSRAPARRGVRSRCRPPASVIKTLQRSTPNGRETNQPSSSGSTLR